jgi:pseudaminic acid synthase
MKVKHEIEIAGRPIGPDHPPYVVAELSGNHLGRLDRALELVDAASATGADAVKIQTYTADTLTIPHEGEDFRIHGGLWDGFTLHQLYQQACTPFEWHPALFERARRIGIPMFSTPFDETAVDLLASLGAPAFKIASFEAVDLPLIAYAASRGKPMIISTGLASLAEIEAAVAAARGAGAVEIALLHCTTAYPAPIEEANVRTVANLAETFGVISGLSDHAPGSAACVAAIALGGCIIEKHITLMRSDGGPDAAFSLEPHEFKRLVDDCKSAWAALGQVEYKLLSSERSNVAFRRSLYVVRPIKAGEQITRENVRSIRPGYGLAPKHLDEVVGRKAARDIAYGERLSWSLIA